jgi:transmembrane sensor
MQERFFELLHRYYQRQASPEELEEFYILVDSGQYDDVLRAFMDNAYDQETTTLQPENTGGYYPIGADARMLRHVFQTEHDQARPAVKVRPLWPRIAAAASILLFLSIGSYFIFHKQPTQQTAKNQIHNDFAPGGNNAILTLSNGQKIILNSAKKGPLAQQGNTAITKAADGKVVYQATGAEDGKSHIQYNTLRTQRGGQYQLVLPDGSKVWLNSVSSITYPTTFIGKERKVVITGEAYFEVVNNDAMPFSVTVNGQTVQDLGTHFNINAYPEEGPIKTTLLEGSIKVAANDQAVVLKPGQQSQVNKANDRITVIPNVDTEQAVAWKDGFFELNNTDVQTIMRQAARWYDVDVAYDGKISHRQLTGKIRRSENASKLLEMLSYFNVHFEVQGRKIIVKQ